MINLETDKENYLLCLNNAEIRFITSRDFIGHFIRFLSSNLEKFNKRCQYLVNLEPDEFSDEISIEREYKEIDYYIFKQNELLNLFTEFKQKLE